MSTHMRDSQGTDSRSANPLRRGWLVTGLLGLLVLVGAVFATAGVLAGSGEKKPEPRIVGGQEAVPGEWPWQVALIRAGADPYNGQFCGGSLIRPDWVVTAAHCVEYEVASDLEILAGIHNLRFPDADYQRRSVAEISIHPDWDTFTADNDIALLRLDSPVTFRPPAGDVLPVAPVGLVAANVGPLTGVESTVTGWGNTLGQPDPGGESFPDALQEVTVPIISNAACNAAYGGITDNMLCAALEQGGRDSCQGDSGGPLQVYDGAQSRWELAGIVSHGYGCAAPGYPGVYTRVSQFIDWINSETGPDITVTDNSYLPLQAAPVPPWITPTATPTITPTPPPEGLPLENGDFEQGPVVWTMRSSTGIDLILDNLAFAGLQPHGGSWAARLGGPDNERSELEQRVIVPANAPFLSYFYVIDSNDYCGYDFAGVKVNGTNNVLARDLCRQTATYGWVQGTADLSAYAGLPVDLMFWVETDGSYGSTWFLDDLVFTSVGPTPTPTPTTPPTATPSPTPTITPTVPPGGLPLENGDFEAGRVAWQETSALGFELIVDRFGTNLIAAHSGEWASWLGGANQEQSTISQRVTIPAEEPFLTYYYQIGSSDECGFDYGIVRVNGSAVETLDLCYYYSYGRWAPRSVDLSAYAGLTVDLSFHVVTDSSAVSNLFIDDVSFRANRLAAEPDSAGPPATDASVPRDGR